MPSKTNHDANIKALVTELRDGFLWLEGTYAGYDAPGMVVAGDGSGDGAGINPPSLSSLPFLRQDLDKPDAEGGDEEAYPLAAEDKFRKVQQRDGVRYEYRWMVPVAKIIFFLVLAVIAFTIWFSFKK